MSKDLHKKLNSGHYLEIMDRLHIIMSTLDDHCIQHPVAKINKKLNSHLSKALDELWEAYQTAGQLDCERNKS